MILSREDRNQCIDSVVYHYCPTDKKLWPVNPAPMNIYSDMNMAVKCWDFTYERENQMGM